MDRSARPVALLAGWLSAMACADASAADDELGRYLSSECVTCHQLSGHVSGGVPQINGWPEDQFVAVMNAYKDNHRDNPVMRTIAGRLAADDIAALAAYFGALAPKPVAK
jgi:cytochrome c553